MIREDWTKAKWHFRGFCHECNGYTVLAKIGGAGDICEKCWLKGKR